MRKLMMVLSVLLLLAGCGRGNIEEAKKVLSQDDSIPSLQVAVLFDNSLSYKAYVEHTLATVEKLFAHLVKKSRSEENIKICLILVDSKASIIYNGTAKDIKMAYDEVAKVLKEGQSPYTDLTGAVNRALYFLNEGKAKRKVMVLFTDMKASTPKYYPGDAETIPPPPDFPWAKIKEQNIETYAFFVPYEEWKLWMPEMNKQGVPITAKFPQDVEMKTGQAYKVIFKEEE